MRKHGIVAGVIIVVLVAVLVGILFYLGAAVKTAVNQAGPRILGVPVSLDHAKVRPLSGTVVLGGLRVGNPEGFKTEQAFSLGSLDIQLDVKSLFSGPIVVRHIHITGPEISYEQTLTGNNLGALIEGLDKGKAGAPEAGEPAPAAEQEQKPGRKVIIEDFQLRGAQVNLSLPGMQGKAIPLPLPPIVLSDIGKESDGASLKETLSKIMGAIVGSVGKVAASSVNLLGSGAKAVGAGAQQGAEAAGDAVLGAGRAVGEGAEKLAGGLKGLIQSAVPGGDSTNAAPAEAAPQ